MNVKKLLMIVAVVLLGAGLFFAGFYARPRYEKQKFASDSAPAKQFVEYVLQGNTDAAYDLTAGSLQGKQGKDVFAETVKAYKADKPETQTGQAVRSGDSIVYYQKALNMPKNAQGSTIAEFYITLQKSEGKWKVTTVNIQ